MNRCERGLQDNEVLKHLKKLVWDFKETLPVVVALRSQYLNEEHWTEIKDIIKSNFDINDENFTLYSLF